MTLGFVGTSTRKGDPSMPTRALGFVRTHIPQIPAIMFLVPVEMDSTRVATGTTVARESDANAAPSSRASLRSLRVWQIVLFMSSIAVPLAFVTRMHLTFEAKNQEPVFLALLSATIAIVSWLQVLLSMNLFNISLLTAIYSRVRSSALLLYLAAGMCYYASALAIMENQPLIQFSASLIASFFSWAGFVAIFSGTYALPTKQQFGSLAQILLLSALWEARAYIVTRYGD